MSEVLKMEILKMETLGEALPREIERCRELVVEYDAIGPSGNFARAMIRAEIDAAEKATAAGDAVAMMKAYTALRDCE